MRRYLLAAVATCAIASPAYAIDGAWYVGGDVGAMLVEDSDMDYTDPLVDVEQAIIIDHDVGYDVDLIGGYDAGSVRLEAEIAYKRASIDESDPTQLFFDLPVQTPVDTDGNVSVISSMGNVLLDFTGTNGWSGYVGPGLGVARVKYDVVMPGLGTFFEDSDTALAFQAIAGIRKQISDSMEIGLKYRFFSTERLHFEGDIGPNNFPFDLSTRFRSHSLMASMIFNFAPPPPPPPPVVVAPPPPPATQTCPDGTVILATEVCPVPPPPPPPPPAGERG